MDEGCTRGGGHPQGAPLRMDEGCTRGGGHPQGGRLPIAFCPGKGTHKGCPYGWMRGAHEGEGTHKGCPYGWIRGVYEGEGTHKGRPYGWIRGAHEGEGTHKGRPYGWMRGAHEGEGTHKGGAYHLSMPWEGRPIRPHIHGWRDKRRIGWNTRMALAADNLIIYRSPCFQIQTERLSPSLFP